MFKKLKLLALFVGIGAFVGAAVPAMAQTIPVDPSQIKDLQGAFTWIITGGAMFFASMIVDRVKAFDSLDTGLRMGAVAALAIVLTWISRVVLQFVPPAWFAALDPFFKDALPYIFSVASIFAAKSIRSGFAKAQTLTKIGQSPFNS
jgi:hypothetical protein